MDTIDVEILATVVNNGTGDFDQLTNRPKYNGTAMTHETNVPEVKTETWDGKYSKPATGIPKTDMASDVQTSLGKADSAIQEHQSLAAYRTSAAQDVIDTALSDSIDEKYEKPAAGIPKTDLTEAVQTSLGKADSALQEHQSLSAYRTASAQDAIDTTKAAASDLTAHTGNTSNPHSVTAEQTAYDSTAQSHTSGSVAAQLSEHSEQIVTLDAKLTSKSASSSDVGKFAKVKRVDAQTGKVSEWEFGEGGSSYVLPQATSSSLGGIKADTVTASDTQPVRINTETGKLFTTPGESFNNVYSVYCGVNNVDYGSVSGSGLYRKNTTATLTATPSSGYSIYKWVDVNTGTKLADSVSSITFTVEANRNINCVFIYDALDLVPWSTGTDAQITAMIQAADDGIINLMDTWSIGDIREIQLTATTAHSEQIAEFVIMDDICTGFTVNGNTPNIIVGLKNGLIERGKMNLTDTNINGWKNCALRNWCNTEFRSLLPTTVRSWFKQFEWSQGAGGKSSGIFTTQDYFGFAPEKCITGIVGYSTYNESILYRNWKYYVNTTNRIKKNGKTGSNQYWWTSSVAIDNTSYFCSITSSGNYTTDRASNVFLLSPFGCI